MFDPLNPKVEDTTVGFFGTNGFDLVGFYLRGNHAENKGPLSFFEVFFIADNAGRICGYSSTIPNLYRNPKCTAKDVGLLYEEMRDAAYRRHIHNHYDKTRVLCNNDSLIVDVSMAELLRHANASTDVRESQASLFKYLLHLDAKTRAEFITQILAHQRKEKENQPQTPPSNADERQQIQEKFRELLRERLKTQEKLKELLRERLKGRVTESIPRKRLLPKGKLPYYLAGGGIIAACLSFIGYSHFGENGRVRRELMSSFDSYKKYGEAIGVAYSYNGVSYNFTSPDPEKMTLHGCQFQPDKEYYSTHKIKVVGDIPDKVLLKLNAWPVLNVQGSIGKQVSLIDGTNYGSDPDSVLSIAGNVGEGCHIKWGGNIEIKGHVSSNAVIESTQGEIRLNDADIDKSVSIIGKLRSNLR